MSAIVWRRVAREQCKHEKLEGDMGREERNHTTVHTNTSFLSNNGCVLDRFGFNRDGTHTSQTPTSYHTVSRTCPSVSWSVCLSLSVHLYFFVYLYVWYVCVCASPCVVYLSCVFLCRLFNAGKSGRGRGEDRRGQGSERRQRGRER